MLTYWNANEDLPKTFCKGLLDVARESVQSEASVTVEGGESERVEGIRNNRIALLNSPELNEVLTIYGAKANQEAGWNFEVDSFEIPQVSFYGKGQFYDWHSDVGRDYETEDTSRKLTLVLTLDDNYRGGDFQIQKWVHPQEGSRFTTLKTMRSIGSIAVFPSFMFHRSTKIHTGEKISLAFWMRGPKFR